MLNDTAKPVITTTSAGYKIDCAKECPCGVPVIPVPDQWLEVMVTGGFKVWHIIFIIIAFLVTIVVVYCCFHRCRIPRTKQEIEADLMRSNLTNKFREYLQEFPNEPTTFLEALKRVADLEEKSEQDDMGARKRKGWLKRMGKERGEKGAEPAKEDTTTVAPDGDAVVPAAPVAAPDETPAPALSDPATLATETKEIDQTPGDQVGSSADDKLSPPSQVVGEADQSKPNISKRALKSKKSGKTESKSSRREVSQEIVDKSAKTKSEKPVATPSAAIARDEADKRAQAEVSGSTNVASRPARARRKGDKPNLSRTKATHGGGSRGESLEASSNNVLTIPVASHHNPHHHHHHQHHHHPTSQHHEPSVQPAPDHQVPTTTTTTTTTATTNQRRVRSKTKERAKDSTVIQIEPSPPVSATAAAAAGKLKKDKK